MQFSSKVTPNNTLAPPPPGRLAPSWEILDPPLGSLTRGVDVSRSLLAVVTVVRIGTEPVQDVATDDKKRVRQKSVSASSLLASSFPMIRLIAIQAHIPKKVLVVDIPYE